jgi:hypothetical protein
VLLEIPGPSPCLETYFHKPIKLFLSERAKAWIDGGLYLIGGTLSRSPSNVYDSTSLQKATSSSLDAFI